MLAVLGAGGYLLGRDSGSRRTVVVTSTPATTTTAPEEEQVITRPLTGGCIPVPGATACDPLRAGLWSGDPEAWRQWAALQGATPPTAADVQAGAIALRLSAGDPAARIDLALATNQPLVLITRLRLRGAGAGRRLVAVEIANVGAAPADLRGLHLPGGSPIAAGSPLAPGVRCEIGPVATPACPGAPAEAGALPLPPGSTVRLLAADGHLLDEVAGP